MKKTLIALVAVAATGAAFAQSSVTLSGKFGYAYQAKETAAGVKTNGFGVTDGNVTFAAVEDLGGGLKASASMDLRVRGRSLSDSGSLTTTGTTTTFNTANVGGRDASISLAGGFGTVMMGAIEAGNGIIGLASAGAPTIGLDDTGTTLDKAGNVDIVRYTSPDMGGFKVYGSVIDSIGGPGAMGLESKSTLTDAIQIGMTYAAGPLALAGDYTDFSKNSSATVTKDFGRTRVSGSYNLGVVKLGAGYQNKAASTVGGKKNDQYMLGVSMPVGSSWLLGATYANNKTSGAKAATGFDLGAQYNFSKRTALQTAYQSEKAAGATSSATHLRIRLMHNF